MRATGHLARLPCGARSNSRPSILMPRFGQGIAYRDENSPRKVWIRTVKAGQINLPVLCDCEKTTNLST
jgi:hypothetical protein